MKCQSLSLGVIFLVAALPACGTVNPQGAIFLPGMHSKFAHRAKYELREARLTTPQRERLAQLLGGRAPAAETVRYYKAVKWRGIGTSDYVFVIDGESAYGPYRLLALVQQRGIHELIQDEPIFKEGRLVISQGFLDQFVGRNLEQSFEIAGTLDDALHDPAKIKPIAGEIELSEEIAWKIRQVLAEVAVLKL